MTKTPKGHTPQVTSETPKDLPIQNRSLDEPIAHRMVKAPPIKK